MKIFPALTGVLLFAGHFAFAQTITVRDQSTLKAVPDVGISGVEWGKVFFTNAKGQFTFSGDQHSDTIQFRKLGFQPL